MTTFYGKGEDLPASRVPSKGLKDEGRHSLAKQQKEKREGKNWKKD